jgi:hypothetical protein
MSNIRYTRPGKIIDYWCEDRKKHFRASRRDWCH